jgi:hypothetical protein
MPKEAALGAGDDAVEDEACEQRDQHADRAGGHADDERKGHVAPRALARKAQHVERLELAGRHRRVKLVRLRV